ncbi:MAG: hypothetical protein HQK54_06120, partial [Oligoflexales bacterium]|nr:hypothetical protein [Oligoflexales bacterium]
YTSGIFINTSRVDQFGFPLRLDVTGLDGFHQSVGETLSESRDELFAQFIVDTPESFQVLAKAPYAPYRIIAPAHASFQKGGESVNYLDPYISEVWEKYRSEDLVINIGGWPAFTGRVSGDTFRFRDDNGGNYYINGKPTTAMVLLGSGLLDDRTGASDIARQLQIQAQVCAALNRHVAENSFDRWWDANYHYPENHIANSYAKFWHDHSIGALAYGFAYDDVGGHSPSIHTPAPINVTYTIGF